MSESTWEPRSSEDYLTFEKLAIFNKLHKQALAHFNEVKKSGYSDEDAEHYIFESVMELLSKPKDPVWTHFNKFLR